MADVHSSAQIPNREVRPIWIWLPVVLGGLGFFVIVWLLWQGLPGDRIVVSRDTTYITEPLQANGLPDYEAFLLDKYRSGVTLQNNAGVLLYQAIWPGELEPHEYQLVSDELGLIEVPSADNALQDWKSAEVRAAVTAWLAERGTIVDGALVDDSSIDEVLFAAIDAPWTASDLPPLAEWLHKNRKPLDLVVEATYRPRCYMPSPSLLNDEHEMLIEMLLPGVQGVRGAARALSARAMNHLGEGRIDDAWNDTLALHRLACLADQTHTIVEKLVAIAIRGMANDATLAILSDEELPLDFARRIQSDLAQLDRRIDLHQTLGTIERISTLDSMVHASIYGFESLSDQSVASEGAANPSNVDWNIVLTRINYWYDRLAHAIAHVDHIERQQAIDQYESDLDESGRDVKHPVTLIKAYFSRRARSETIASICSNLMLPAVSTAIAAEERNQATLQLIDVAAALAVYRAQHGQYPKTLEEMTPELLPKSPVDPIRSLALVYKSEGDGYLLYCQGPNGIDEEGSNHLQSIFAGRKASDLPEADRYDFYDNIPADADDYSIRVPTPAFKVPAPPASQP